MNKKKKMKNKNKNKNKNKEGEEKEEENYDDDDDFYDEVVDHHATANSNNKIIFYRFVKKNKSLPLKL